MANALAELCICSVWPRSPDALTNGLAYADNAVDFDDDIKAF